MVDSETVIDTDESELGPVCPGEEADDVLSDLFRMSGGVAYTSARTANRIDGLLTKMLEHPSACRYLPDADENLDYLLTHLKLDLIEQMARDVASREDDDFQASPGPPEESEPAIPLDRVRPSL